MKIRFKDNDPRRGQEIELDDIRAGELIAAGSAVAVKVADEEKAAAPVANKAIPAAPENKAAPKAAAKKATKKAR